MDFVRAVKFPFDDDDWIVKTVIGTLLSFIPLFSAGYQVNVARNVMRDREYPLPGSDDIGPVLTDGILATIAAILYTLPILPFVCVLMVMSGIFGESDVGGAMMACVWLCMMPLMLLYAVPAAGVYTMGVIRYAETGNFSEFIRIGALWRDLRDNLNTMLMLLLYLIALGIVMSVVSSILWITCIGLPLLGFWYQIASGHLIGQAGRLVVHGE